MCFGPYLGPIFALFWPLQALRAILNTTNMKNNFRNYFSCHKIIIQNIYVHLVGIYRKYVILAAILNQAAILKHFRSFLELAPSCNGFVMSKNPYMGKFTILAQKLPPLSNFQIWNLTNIRSYQDNLISVICKFVLVYQFYNTVYLLFL